MQKIFLALLGLSAIIFWPFNVVFAQAKDGKALFRNISQAAGIHAEHTGIWDPHISGRGYLAIGQAWGDYDNDGWPDLFVTGNLKPNTLYRNEGDGSFSLSSFSQDLSITGLQSGGAVWADYDNDGWQDLYLLNFGPNVLFHNEAGQGFKQVKAGVEDKGKGTSATWGDYDGDGWLDLYVVNWSCLPECQPEDISQNQDRLYHNKGDGSFSDVSELLDLEKTLGAGFAASFFDIDNDGDSDLYVANDKLTHPIGNVLWRNDGPGCGGWCWQDISQEAKVASKMHAMGIAVGDYDNDSFQDVFLSNMLSPMSLAKNLGNAKFQELAEQAGVMVLDRDRWAVGWGTEFFDYDNDGWLDLYIAISGLAPGPPGLYGGSAPSMDDFHHPHADMLFHNEANGNFKLLPSSFLEANEAVSMGFAYADYDRDGWLDFVQGNWNEGFRLYHNEALAGRGNDWLSLWLKGGEGVNLDAIGTRVKLVLSDGRELFGEVRRGSSLGASHQAPLHFGLAKSQIQTLTILWPNGHEQTLENISSNQLLTISYPK
ncbi:MAG: CRTAC1 family protein [Deinococcales bacterium]